MKKIFKTLLFFSIYLYGNQNYTLAIDNRGNEIITFFEGFTLKLYTNKVLSGTSTGTISVYGNINSKSTTSLIKINSRYVEEDIFLLKVYQGDTLVGESNELVLIETSLKFNDIETSLDYGKIGLTNAEKAMLLILLNRTHQLNLDNELMGELRIAPSILIKALLSKDKEE